MFDIDLLNKSGLQKIISRQKINGSSEKAKIIFKDPNFEANLEDGGHDDDIENFKDGLLSYVVTISLVLCLIVFAFLDYKQIFSISTSDDLIISSLIRLVNHSDTRDMLDSIIIDDEVKLIFYSDNASKIKQVESALEEESYQYKIYESNDRYVLEAKNTISTFHANDQEIKMLLNSLVSRYDKSSNMSINREHRYIRFISDYKTIFGILEELINFGTTKISLHGDINSNLIGLEFYY